MFLYKIKPKLPYPPRQRKGSFKECLQCLKICLQWFWTIQTIKCVNLKLSDLTLNMKKLGKPESQTCGPITTEQGQ